MLKEVQPQVCQQLLVAPLFELHPVDPALSAEALHAAPQQLITTVVPKSAFPQPAKPAPPAVRKQPFQQALQSGSRGGPSSSSPTTPSEVLFW